MNLTDVTSGDTVASRFLANVAAHGDSIALRERQADGSYRVLTYRQYAEQVARCVAGLKALGFGPGQRLVLMLRNRPEFHVLDIAACFCGGTPVSIYNSSSAEQIEYLVGHCEATIAIADDAEFLARFRSVRAKLPTLKHLGVLGSQVPEGVFGWDALLDHAPVDLNQAVHACEPDQLATLIYTSGTTGRPKAVMLTHRTAVWTCARTLELISQHPKLRDGMSGVRCVSYLPMAHIAERNTGHYIPTMYGSEVTCCPEPTQIALYLREVKPQIVFGVPRVWEKLHAGIQAAVSGDPARAQKLKEAVDAALVLVEKIHAGTATDQDRATYQFLEDVAFKNLRALIGLDETLLALTGAAPLPRELQLWFRAIGVPISDVYGMSECCGPMTWSPMAAKPGTVGRPLPGVEVKLGEDGEILCRGGNVFSGYLKSEKQTEEALADGWLHSGDIGKFDEDGYLSIVDRKKELIITAGGDNISPANLEAALKCIPLVGQACVIGDQRPFVTALIVLDPDVARVWANKRGMNDPSLATLATNRELIAEVEAGLTHAMENFGRVEKVKRITILANDWLPDSEELTPTAKLKRRAIHAKYKAEIEALYATTLAPPVEVAAGSKREAG
ncbi:MAG TPA: AMP-dependent synthetase/ligase [Polyangiales bacterium]|nr:AMP-dependent synthetase/ligase [Polyangiales bacterium]